ncbi:transmembrane protein, putative (macronuclear) [Tetrahymena thermophila SB210]|uniref:Transmembrane protein, putative n=1 Tax=Tetrahymena thermophila (strain SB210) TaxID=312017 RepID=W7WZB4_TETTS|nr:transmembrane protein, putative [Tetrahymena thermophila SB210]EWS70947.1 transmembrane protein, putative [Tetrahymena thermophila SB210]|eukprot:XP_012656503.1 transmembrane protein, putative [Tetrahymena thermophila SB210]
MPLKIAQILFIYQQSQILECIIHRLKYKYLILDLKDTIEKNKIHRIKFIKYRRLNYDIERGNMLALNIVIHCLILLNNQNKLFYNNWNLNFKKHSQLFIYLIFQLIFIKISIYKIYFKRNKLQVLILVIKIISHNYKIQILFKNRINNIIQYALFVSKQYYFGFLQVVIVFKLKQFKILRNKP